MAEEYELKQVKVRLKLAEAEPLYSTEQITTSDKAVEVMAQALAQLDREYCCVVNLDGANHPINFNVVSIGDVNQAHVPIQNVFKSAILSNATGIMMFHNHPSGSLNASREDIDVTKRLIEAGQIMNIPVIDHIIVAGGTAEHFSFHDNNPEMFKVAERTEYSVHEPQAKLDPDMLMVRPTYKNFGVYEKTGENRARVIFEGSEQECRDKLNEFRERYWAGTRGDSFSIYQLKDDEVLHDIRFESLDYLNRQGIPVDKANYDVVYTAPLKQGETLDDLYYRFNMEHPLDFRGHSMSMSDVVVLHHGAEDKAFYVDRIGFAELPEFLLEKTAEKEVETIGSLMEEQRSLRYQISTEEEELDNLVQGGIGNDAEIEKVSNNLSYLREELESVSDRLDKLYELQDEEYGAQFLPDEMAFKLEDRYITIQTCEEGYDYSIYDENYHLLDGGVYDDPAVSIRWALDEIAYELKAPRYDERADTYSRNEKIVGNIHMGSELERVDYDELMEHIEAVGAAEIEAVQSAQGIVDDFRAKTEQLFDVGALDGMRPADIEDAVREQVRQVIDEYGIDATIKDVIVSGSRCRGLENEKSDLDVVVSYSGTEREDAFFNLLHDEKIYMGSVELDINPIGTEQTGTLAEHLPRVENYLTKKNIERDKGFKEEALSLMGKYGYVLVEEQDKGTDYTLIRPANEEESFGFDGWEMIRDYFKEVDALVDKHSLQELRSRLDGDVTKIPFGISDEQLRAAIHFKADQSIIKAFPEREGAVRTENERQRIPDKIVSFTVAESSEFHSFGELHEGIPTLQDAVEIYERLCKDSLQNSIPALGIHLHTTGTPDRDDLQWDFLSGGRIDLEGLMYLPEMTQSAEIMEALHQLAEMYPQAEVIGHFPEERETSGPTVQKSETEVGKTDPITAEELATEIDRFAYENDTYEYKDTVDDRENNIRGIAESIESGQDGGARAYLNSFVQESDDAETVAEAKELLKKLDEYKPLAKVEEMEEQNYNMIDNVINNLPQDPEEKKEPAPQREMRVAEVKKVRKRVSMKEKLAEKKAEIAEKDKKPPEADKAKKPPSMGVDD